jgi:hypothetical protein
LYLILMTFSSNVVKIKTRGNIIKIPDGTYECSIRKGSTKALCWEHIPFCGVQNEAVTWELFSLCY